MKTNKKGFTLIELLVVIGIIGVLSAVMIGTLGGSNNAARATQCMTNMRGLSVAVLNYAMQHQYGWMPGAGSYKYTHPMKRNNYPTYPGWISWGSGSSDSSPACPSYIMFNESDQKVLRYAITNGCIWAMGGKTEKIYRCPTHEAACKKANKRPPGWSYVMNESFFWNDAGKAIKGDVRALSHGGLNVIDAYGENKNRKMRPPEKVLLFAEMQGLDDKKRGLTANTGGSGNRGDSVLQYKNENEQIGFNHEQSGGKLAGHVAFADGHVEKFMYPASGDAQLLTKCLCSGREVSFNGTAYQDISK